MDVKYCFKTQIVDECNLNCVGCDHFAPLAKPWHQPLEDFIDMMKLLKQTVGTNIKEIELYGGEPLLHEKFYQMLMAVQVIFPHNVIVSIESNGLLLDKFLQENSMLQNNQRIEYKITEYLTTKGIVDKLQQKYPSLNIFRSKHTPIEKQTNSFCYKTHMFNVGLSHEIDSQNQLKIYNSCYAKSFEKNSVCLRNWKISPCPLVMCLDIFDQYFNENFYNENNYVKLDENFTVKQLDKIANMPCEHCKQCGHVVYGFPYRRSECKKTEWCLSNENVVK